MKKTVKVKKVQRKVKMKNNSVTIIGAGLAGCEAAWQLAKYNISVKLIDMKPNKMTEAHSYKGLAELVCSNSLKAQNIENSSGLLKEELRILGSLIIEAADFTKLPAGGALAVDRKNFSDYITKKINENPYIEYISREVKNINIEEKTIIATGPLTTDELKIEIGRITGQKYLHFYDAASPIISKDSIDFNLAFFADRYDKGNNDYINCPMTKNEYLKFNNELINGERVIIKAHEKKEVFEGCMPLEIMASRGIETLRYGPLKPVGIKNPKTGENYFAIVQLRQDNIEGSIYNMVGFQTNLKFSEQKRIFSMIPGLKEAEFYRYGVMHKNTYINSPKLLDNIYRMTENKNIYFAGQITGVEGYVESISSGLVAGINMAMDIKEKENIIFNNETGIGALVQYISNSSLGSFQPMNVNYGIINKGNIKIKNKQEKNIAISKKALDIVRNIQTMHL